MPINKHGMCCTDHFLSLTEISANYWNAERLFYIVMSVYNIVSGLVCLNIAWENTIMPAHGHSKVSLRSHRRSLSTGVLNSSDKQSVVAGNRLTWYHSGISRWKGLKRLQTANPVATDSPWVLLNTEIHCCWNSCKKKSNVLESHQFHVCYSYVRHCELRYSRGDCGHKSYSMLL